MFFHILPTALSLPRTVYGYLVGLSIVDPILSRKAFLPKYNCRHQISIKIRITSALLNPAHLKDADSSVFFTWHTAVWRIRNHCICTHMCTCLSALMIHGQDRL